MTDYKKKSTLTKIGKLFGVSSPNNVTDSKQSNSSNDSIKSISDNSSNLLSSDTSNLNLNLNTNDKENNKQIASTSHSITNSNSNFFKNDGSNNQSNENDKLAPLPKDLSPVLNPPSSISNFTPKSQPVSRNSSTKKPHIVTNSNPVSRSSSMKLNTPTTSSPSNFLQSNNSSQVNLMNINSNEKTTGSAATNPRFLVTENGHEHHLKSARRQEKLGHMLKDLLGAKKLRDEAVSAVPNILSSIPKDKNAPPTLFAGLVNQVKKGEETVFGAQKVLQPQPLTAMSVNARDSDTKVDLRSFAEKYGRCQEVVGRGGFGVVRISHKKVSNDKESLYAVKEFKRKPQEDDKKYSRRLTSEFCISSSLKHMNIIHTLDLLQDAKGDYCEVMEFCSGGDLYTLIITAGKLEYAEADCFFKQLIRGVNYMHQMGVSHRDLKPENLLLTENGNIKITDFGNGECFKMAWETDIHLSTGVCGSSPYIAPEEYTSEEFDPRAVDIWACGVIYMAMRTGRQLWKLANEDDEFYLSYLNKRKDAKGYEPIECLKRARCRNVIYSILDPVPSRRITGKQILNSEWGREIKVCEAGEHDNQN